MDDLTPPADRPEPRDDAAPAAQEQPDAAPTAGFDPAAPVRPDLPPLIGAGHDAGPDTSVPEPASADAAPHDPAAVPTRDESSFAPSGGGDVIPLPPTATSLPPRNPRAQHPAWTRIPDRRNTRPGLPDTRLTPVRSSGEAAGMPPIERVTRPAGDATWRPSDRAYSGTDALPTRSTGLPRPGWEEPTKPRRVWPAAMMSGLLGAGLLAAVLWAGGVIPADDTVVAGPPGTVVREVRTEIVTTQDVAGVAPAVGRKVVPSVVTVEIAGPEDPQNAAEDPTDFLAFGSGSGVVMSEDGYIITNEHVINGADRIRVIFQDGRIYSADVVGSDALTDLAVLRISASGLVPIEFGSTDDLEIGEMAIAVGNPLGLIGGASLTVGVVSAFNREVIISADDILFGMLQTDAPITQGSSGGALVDAQGRLIGITSAIGVSDAGAEGIGFAIPVEITRRIVDEIIEKGRVHHAFLGVQGRDHMVTAPDGAIVPNGAVVVDIVDEATSAAAAGLQPGDVIVRFDDNPVRTMQDLVIGLRGYRVGDAVEFEVERDGERFTTTVILGERPDGL